MKHFNKIILAAFFSGMIVFNSCSDSYFDVNPIGGFDESSYWKQESDIKSWIAGIYSGVQATLGSNYLHWGESRSDNFLPATVYGGKVYQTELLTADNTACEWKNLYAVISRCNMGLENIDRVTSVSEANMKIYKGQMYAIRAWMYFYAIRVWGDVPMILQTWDGSVETKFNPRTPVDTIKAKVLEKDLEQAIDLLPVDVATVFTDGNSFFFNQASVRALRMDIDLWFRDNYQRVIDDADEIELLKKYSLVTTTADWKKIFTTPDLSKETILTLHWGDWSVNGVNPYGALIGNAGKNPMFWVSNEVFDIMMRDKNDVRFWGVLDTLVLYNDNKGANKQPITSAAIQFFDGTPTCGHRIAKFDEMNSSLPYGFVEAVANNCEYKLPIYRYADVLLMRAEALNNRNNAGDAEEVIMIINKIRNRCGNRVVADIADYPVQLGWSALSRERLILDERQIEFYGEGKRWFDLRRSGELFYAAMDEHLKIQQNYYGQSMIGFPRDGRELWPLARAVFSSNPLMVGHQNPPYSE